MGVENAKSQDLDPNKIIVEFLNSNLDKIVDSVKSVAKGTRNTIRCKLQSTYREYLERTLNRYSKAKSFFIRSEPIYIYQFFVLPDISTQQRTLRSPGLRELTAIAPACILTGSGGCGKTMLMRHLLVSSLYDQLKTPVFLELRQITEQGQSLRSMLLSVLITNGLEIDDRYFEKALESGHFCFLLDAFDELHLPIQKRIAREIQELRAAYPHNYFVVSSRPDSQLQGWVSFAEFSIDPLSLDKAIELVAKLPFDDPIKDKFISAMQSGLYERHESFLSNALLLSIMLLTYSDIAHIPSKLSIFYSQAYESLFQKHDALKEGFQRHRRTSLDIQDFAKAFAAFCLQTYDRREFAFTRVQALEFFDRAREVSGMAFASDGILDDAVQAVCLMIEDGLQLTFAHRSFQEYFVARFVRAAPPATKERLIKRFAPRVGDDAVMQLLFEMDPFSVEKHYILPSIERFRRIIKLRRKVGVTHGLRFIKKIYSRLEVRERGESGGPAGLAALIKDNELWSAMHFVDRNYPAADGIALRSASRSGQQLANVFKDEYPGRASIATSKLTTNSKLYRAMIEDTYFWGLAYVQHVCDVSNVIRRRHEEASSSLDALLGDRDD